MSLAVLIINPSSGNEEGEQYTLDAQATLEKMFDRLIVKKTEKAGDAKRFANEAAKDRVEAVFVMGGDGTINECVNGISGEAYRPDFGFIPMGTANDLGHALGIPMDPAEAIAMLSTAAKRKIDVGKVNDDYFIDVIAIGSIPEAVQNVSTEQKTKLGFFAYILEGLKAAKKNKSYSFKLTLDEKTFSQEAELVLVALTNSVGGFSSLLPEAKADDGYLHLVLLKKTSLLKKLPLLLKLLKGETNDTRDVLYERFKTGQVAVSKKEKLGANIDGDPGDDLPLTLEVLASHITVFVPS